VRLGSTIDDAAGEAFDKIAKALGLPYPGGPALERLAEGGDAARFPFAVALAGREGCDFSFSGLKTEAARIAERVSTDDERRDLAAAVQSAIARQLADRSERAMEIYREGHRELAVGRLGAATASLRFVVAGGVAANAHVRGVLRGAAERHGFSFTAPPLEYCGDNGAMIALAGAERMALGLVDGMDAVARPRWPLDEAAAKLRPTHIPGRKGAKA
jgi:N6-L-threonylcarbamoyladenine synthase